MDIMEKVEKLREKANVSYEEAKNALEEANGDLLDAMIILEKQGKVEKPSMESFSTKYEDNVKYPPVVQTSPEEKNNDKKSQDRSGEKGSEFKEKMKKLWKKANENFLIVTRHDEVLLDIPIWVFILILALSWHISFIVMLISLFFGCRYRFIGPADMDCFNNASDKVSDAADKIKEEFNRKQGEQSQDEQGRA